jgi:hypothetical protein
MALMSTEQRLDFRPITLRQARAFVQEYHRHHDAPQGGLFALALMRGDELVGVAIAGRPVSGELQRRGYLEVTRVCVLEGVRNGSSRLYGRVRRIAALMGYTRTITYTLPSEGGASLRGAGFQAVAETEGGSWSRPSRPRIDTHPTEPKLRWEAAA